MRKTNRAAYLDSDHRFSLAERRIPEPSGNEVVIEIMANGICGSDIHFFHEGRLGNFIVTKPYIPGHEASGVVAGMGGSVRGFSVGDHVVVEPGIPCGLCSHCRAGRYNLCRDVTFLSAPPVDGTFCDYVSVRSDCVFKIPKSLAFEEAALIEPAAVAVHAVNRARAHNGRSAAIVGAGPIGLLTLQAFKASGGGKAICIDRLDGRLEMAKKLGADEVMRVGDRSGQDEDLADIVFETAGSAAATSSLFKMVSPGGTVVQVGWPDRNVVNMDIACFLEKELDYVAVNRYANAFPTAIEWVSDGRINVRDLITHKFAFAQTAEAFQFTLDHPADVIKTVVVNE